MMELVKKLYKDEEGQGLVEYGLIIGLVAVLLIGSLTALKGGIANVFSEAEEELSSISN